MSNIDSLKYRTLETCAELDGDIKKLQGMVDAAREAVKTATSYEELKERLIAIQTPDFRVIIV